MSSTAAGVVVKSAPKVIDSHLHVWANTAEAESSYPYATGQEPPESLANEASVERLLEKMNDAGVDGALIVQPINHKFDHSYVLNAAMEQHPTRFKGMLLHDPSLSKEAAVASLEDLCLKGFVGVRFNPYLWPKLGDSNKWTPISSTEAGLAVYQRCAELQMPVGLMCFQGLDLHYDDILQLLKLSPKTSLILDHFGFTSLEKPDTFTQLLELARYPQVVVKISALFRQGTTDMELVRSERLIPLLKAFGPDRLMFGTDFPFVLEQPQGYKGTVDLVSSWLLAEDNGDGMIRNQVMGGTAERLFGPWGSTTLGRSDLTPKTQEEAVKEEL